MKKVSVALCTYNGEKYLKQQVDSILNQSGNFDIEIIVCDDLSSDKTIEILNDYKLKFPNIFHIFINENNLGSTKNFEKAISICDGDYIFLSDQDDIWHKDKISKTIEKFDKSANIYGVFTNANLIDGLGNKYSDSKLWDNVFFLEDKLVKPIDFVDLILRNGNIVTGATLCIKNEVKNFIFPFANDVLHDEWIATVLALKNEIDYLNEDLISYRIHENQQVGLKSKKKIEKKIHQKNIILGIDKPKKFIDFRILIKKEYLKYAKLRQLKNLELDLKDLKKMTIDCKQKLSDLNSVAKKKFPIIYILTSITDKILGKRQLL